MATAPEVARRPARPFQTRASLHTLSHLAGLTLALVCLAALLAVAQAALLTARQVDTRVAAGSRAAARMFANVYMPERDSRGRFSWAGPDAKLRFGQVARADALGLEISLGPPPPQLVGTVLKLVAGGRTLGSITVDARPRRYQVLVPRDLLGGELVVELRGETVAVPPDVRRVGVRLESAGISPLGAGLVWPSPQLLAVQSGLLALAALLLARVGARPAWAAAGAALLAGGLLAAFHSAYLQHEAYAGRLALALALLLGLTHWGMPLFERWAGWAGPPRLLRGLWCVALLACALRLAGSLYPLFSAYDIRLNVGRLLGLLGGILVDTNESFEFRGGTAIYPAGPYLALVPGLLLGLAPAPLVQAGIALLDGLSVLAIGLLARRLGLAPRAALVATLVAAIVPIGLTSLYYGHTAQIFGQALMAPLALALLRACERNRWRDWLAAGALLCMALLSHIGVSILAVAWLGLLWLALGAMAARRRMRPAPGMAELTKVGSPRPDHAPVETEPKREEAYAFSAGGWRRLTAMLAISGVVGLLLVYAPLAAVALQGLRHAGAQVGAEATPPAYNLIARAFWIAYHPLGMLLALPGMVLLPRLRGAAGALVGCWLAACALFWAVEMWSGLQVRYLIFLTPLAAIASGQLLDRLARRGTAGRVAAIAVLGLVLAQTWLLWHAGAFDNIAPSMVPLLR